MERLNVSTSEVHHSPQLKITLNNFTDSLMLNRHRSLLGWLGGVTGGERGKGKIGQG